VLIPLLALPAIWPLYARGMLRSADGELHLLRLVTLDQQVMSGVLYPRWVPELTTGLGHPLFSFYAPASYYLMEALHLLGLTFPLAFTTALAVLIVGSGFGMYVLARDVLGRNQRWPALVSAVAYMYSPYLLTNAYIRGALPELFAQALLPWVFWSLRNLVVAERPHNYVLPLALSLAGVAVTHNITLLLAPPFLVGYAFVLWWWGGRKRARLLWIVVGFAVAAALSAAFWMPLIAQSSLVSEEPFAESVSTFVPENTWAWNDFLDTHPAFEYTFSIPYRLGLVQLAVALAGLLLARRRDPEWLFLLIAALLAGLCIGSWAEPLWLSSRILLVVQFPWRLLGVMSVPLALFAGGTVLRLKKSPAQVAVSLAVIALLVVANQPRVDRMRLGRFSGAQDIGITTVAQFEFETHALGTSFLQEFMPRWSSGNEYAPSLDLSAELTTPQLHEAGRYDLDMTIDSPGGGPLRFMNLYFPGWRVVLDGQQVLKPYPSTNMGLLTVDLPPGVHRLTMDWADTPVQRTGEVISLLTLVGLCIFVIRYTDRRWLASIPLVLLIFSLVAAFWLPPATEVMVPRQPVGTDDFTMLGYRLEQRDGRNLTIYPVWYVRKTPPKDVYVRWEMRDKTGQLVAWDASRSFLNSLPASNWPPGTIVDDLYQLPLPLGLAAGKYELTAQILPVQQSQQTAPISVATYELKNATPSESVEARPANSLDVAFGPDIRMAGYDVEINETIARHAGPVVVGAGGTLDYILYWRTTKPLAVDYSATVLLVGANGEHLTQRDKGAGGPFRPPTLWVGNRLHADKHEMRIPKTASAGLYRPYVAIYDSQTGELQGDGYWLPAAKVLRTAPETPPEHETSVRFGEMATLLGYDLSLGDAEEERQRPEVHRGSEITLTLYFRSDAATPTNYTRFVHLYDPQLGMAVQADSPPTGGINPTSAWLPGEVIVDRVPLTIAQDAAPGVYTLRVGLYDPSDGTRVPVEDRTGNLLADAQVVLMDLRIED
jgi:hypothetical protein